MTQRKSERKNNKKSAVIIVLLLALTSILCFGGYTLSKYVTSGSKTGTAQVAKWGYTVELDGNNLFGKNYKFDGVVSKTTADSDSLTVKASGDYSVIAPGTTGSLTFKIKGKAEVRALIAMGIHPHNDVILKMKKTNGEEIEYKPVKWTLKKNEVVVPTAENTSLEAVALTFHSDSALGVKAPGFELPETTYELIWAWAFEGTETFNGVTANELDTILGRCANDNSYVAYGDWTIEKVCTEIKFDIDAQVSQFNF